MKFRIARRAIAVTAVTFGLGALLAPAANAGMVGAPSKPRACWTQYDYNPYTGRLAVVTVCR